eukprot:CAMPEP_0194050646 /NCGR_PEP_ID=MMETSP0009_2-20130614/36334_1 /TAXON_ID=210454 /ORGANISM="Grammatophora oceanica, Strain CCMP 410" /LENGTH=231 /DNA_ID=CAMNT_0038697379 /DNA_START=29 /DNA_END=725 /DNA_ORIENTATION=+
MFSTLSATMWAAAILHQTITRAVFLSLLLASLCPYSSVANPTAITPMDGAPVDAALSSEPQRIRRGRQEQDAHDSAVAHTRHDREPRARHVHQEGPIVRYQSIKHKALKELEQRFLSMVVIIPTIVTMSSYTRNISWAIPARIMPAASMCPSDVSCFLELYYCEGKGITIKWKQSVAGGLNDVHILSIEKSTDANWILQLDAPYINDSRATEHPSLFLQRHPWEHIRSSEV